ncbi:hypothetical protein BOTBODRAFT_33744 [Botryobasidium botryosum FD-172 SS1]|uniref:Uncharacterized protein n=1 Tax=Botryobasidium botryosum (strain FD-172 SS1) TaxID=930990 RepID=A0A067MC36_BOTB1|nr:hypothetical protein BOTBODRAFT_33744 [Botryobasidium botryosum FD-172 SS1]
MGCLPVFAASLPYGPLITLTSTDPNLPLPDPRYLGLHAACAKVIHASGAAEVAEQMTKDVEGINVLAEDGSSSDILSAAFSLASVSVYEGAVPEAITI